MHSSLPNHPGTIRFVDLSRGTSRVVPVADVPASQRFAHRHPGAGVPQAERAGVPQADRAGVPQADRAGVPQAERAGVPQADRAGDPQAEPNASDDPHAEEESIPVVEVEMMALDDDGNLVDPAVATQVQIKEMGPNREPLRWTTMRRRSR